VSSSDCKRACYNEEVGQMFVFWRYGNNRLNAQKFSGLVLQRLFL